MLNSMGSRLGRALDLRQIAAAQDCLLESAALNQNEIHASMILSTRPNDRGFARRRSASEELELWSVLRCCHAVGSVTMEDTMCWEIDYKFFAEQKKAQQTRIEQERRAGVIHQLLNEANKQGEPSNVEGTPAKETAPAK